MTNSDVCLLAGRLFSLDVSGVKARTEFFNTGLLPNWLAEETAAKEMISLVRAEAALTALQIFLTLGVPASE